MFFDEKKILVKSAQIRGKRIEQIAKIQGEMSWEMQNATCKAQNWNGKRGAVAVGIGTKANASHSRSFASHSRFEGAHGPSRTPVPTVD